MLPLFPGSLHSGTSSFTDERSLEFGQCSHDMENQTSAGTCGIDLFSQEMELRIPFAKFIDESN